MVHRTGRIVTMEDASYSKGRRLRSLVELKVTSAAVVRFTVFCDFVSLLFQSPFIVPALLSPLGYCTCSYNNHSATMTSHPTVVQSTRDVTVMPDP